MHHSIFDSPAIPQIGFFLPSAKTSAFVSFVIFTYCRNPLGDTLLRGDLECSLFLHQLVCGRRLENSDVFIHFRFGNLKGTFREVAIPFFQTAI
jgi:hypothetical protein